MEKQMFPEPKPPIDQFNPGNQTDLYRRGFGYEF